MSLPDDIAKAVLYLSSKKSIKITGEIIKCDGGRSLTSSGFIPWKGSNNMNSRFEPDGYNFKHNVNNTIKKVLNGEITGKYPATQEEIDKLINESNWATKLTEAHNKFRYEKEKNYMN
jgi:hypothetical protein